MMSSLKTKSAGLSLYNGLTMESLTLNSLPGGKKVSIYIDGILPYIVLKINYIYLDRQKTIA